ncbi:sensor histidine kinase [Nocardia ignorata]|uniref:histidine kinase n=2 Tax=Nocardia ignorata TaxID=145285 RepID=A0A4R6PK90_NOCIG|nr:sensor histidine kinase [Nocardia ignorata]TDP38043.1 HAMP domain-containing protein [Nocardia ignorata]
MTTTAHDRKRLISRMTAQGWFQLVFASMIVAVIVGAVAGAQVIAHTNRVTDRLVAQTLPAAAEAARLQGALVNEEAGIRGYVLTRDPLFVSHYTSARQDEAKAVERLEQLIESRPELQADLTALLTAADLWRTAYAEPVIAQGGAPNGTDMGITYFGELRSRFATQNDNLTAAVDRDNSRLDTARTTRNLVLSGIVVAFLVTGAALTVLVRRLVVRPLGYLTESSRRVAAGEFDSRIDPVGPSDIALVCAAVENMRDHIVAELASSRVQESVLHQQKQELADQAEELRRSNTELEQFAYVASHDLQEPLRKVASFCQLLDKRYGDQLDERGKQYIDFAVDGAKRMQILINDLLTFSRVGRVSDGTEPVELADSLDAGLTALSSSIEETGAVIERPEQLPRVEGEPTLLVMLWQNIIGNAIKFRTPGSTPLIRITCTPDDTGSGWQFSVADNGIGIDAEFADKVFVIFQRLHARDAYSGTGIGLAVCKKIVEFHGGRIWIDTDYHNGTRLCFTLPTLDESTTASDARKEAIA